MQTKLTKEQQLQFHIIRANKTLLAARQAAKKYNSQTLRDLAIMHERSLAIIQAAEKRAPAPTPVKKQAK